VHLDKLFLKHAQSYLYRMKWHALSRLSLILQFPLRNWLQQFKQSILSNIEPCRALSSLYQDFDWPDSFNDVIPTIINPQSVIPLETIEIPELFSDMQAKESSLSFSVSLSQQQKIDEIRYKIKIEYILLDRFTGSILFCFL
jgi:hypothetical protein